MVHVWRENVVIPTYEIGEAEKNPIFLEKRVYQGSSGVVYPYPVIEKISDTKTDHTYNALFLENDYIKVMILPELGGRVQMAYDKIKQRHFVYYNRVVKPALVGLTGPWISGGIEFNWPQHHRPSTFLPTDCTIEEKDHSVTVWIGEMEQMFHQKCSVAFTLREGCAYLEIKARLYNRTNLPQTFLWWANPAVHVNDAYQSVFPQDVNAVFDHGKRAVSSFPIATGTYYKMDYSAGVDISNYRNIKVPTSYMAVNSKYNFEGGYENDTHGGMLHVASNHFSPGKKQWTWGNGDFGRAWDRNLTDEDGPYIELMAGVYTENQPDFTWLQPYEEKQFTQYFMPYRELGIVKQASRDFILNIEKDQLLLLSTSRQHVRVRALNIKGDIIYDAWLDLTPEEVFSTSMPKETKVGAIILSRLEYGEEREVLRWEPEPEGIRPIPDAAEAALAPCDIKTNDQLYYTGLHIEQYRHATFVATDYYEEALRRDPNDARCLNQMGLWYLRRGRFDKAEPYLRKAVRIIQKRNPNPYDSEPIYNLALTLKYQGRKHEAYELFWKATWSKAQADAAFTEAAQISLQEGRLNDALDEIERALVFGGHNQKALALKAIALRKMGRSEEAFEVCRRALELEPFNGVCLYEMSASLFTAKESNYDEVALDYREAGCEEEAMAIWQKAIEERQATPMTYYYMGRYAEAEQADSAYCFPNSLEAILALEQAKVHNPKGAKAPYYLGCLYYDKRQYDIAIENWEISARIDPSFPTVWRNLALAYFNKLGKEQEALSMMERSFSLNPHDSRILMELDGLRKRLNHSPQERLMQLVQYDNLVAERDDLLLEKITLLNQVGRYEEAMRLLDGHVFHPWEGGEGKVPKQYQVCRVALALQAIEQQNYERAIQLLQECLEYPPHLGEGKLFGAQDNDFLYYLGVTAEKMGDHKQACSYWEQATHGPQEPAAAMYYNDAKPEKIYFQGLALLAIGRVEEAHGRFYRLINFGKQHYYEHQEMDYFAVSLPDLLVWEDSLDRRNRIHCLYMLALGYSGLGDLSSAARYMDELLEIDPYHEIVPNKL